MAAIGSRKRAVIETETAACVSLNAAEPVACFLGIDLGKDLTPGRPPTKGD